MGVAGSLMPWTWAIFRPSIGAATGGVFKLSHDEATYCYQLGRWWDAIQKTHHPETDADATNANTTVYDLALTTPGQNSGGRVHRLLKDASPDAPPNGYFDCTIEVSTLST